MGIEERINQQDLIIQGMAGKIEALEKVVIKQQTEVKSMTIAQASICTGMGKGLLRQLFNNGTIKGVQNGKLILLHKSSIDNYLGLQQIGN